MVRSRVRFLFWFGFVAALAPLDLVVLVMIVVLDARQPTRTVHRWWTTRMGGSSVQSLGILFSTTERFGQLSPTTQLYEFGVGAAQIPA